MLDEEAVASVCSRVMIGDEGAVDASVFELEEEQEHEYRDCKSSLSSKSSYSSCTLASRLALRPAECKSGTGMLPGDASV